LKQSKIQTAFPIDQPIATSTPTSFATHRSSVHNQDKNLANKESENANSFSISHDCKNEDTDMPSNVIVTLNSTVPTMR
jgi:hypothetical protein